MHQGLLSSSDPAVDAKTIVEQVIDELDRALKGATG
jgi:hypothetical protein